MSIDAASTMALPGAATLDALRSDATRDPKATVREAARQFESLLTQELLKSMRAGSLGADWLENAGSEIGRDMLDGQLASQMSGRPGGLADLIARQLERQLGSAAPDAAASINQGALRSAMAPRRAAPVAAAAAGPINASQKARQFVRQHQHAARAAEAETGIPAAYIIGQAAHESGWGRHEIRNADGSSSHNLFGIKAGGSWKGKVASVTTTEYINGKPRKLVAKFRAYDSYQESFLDWARLIKNSPRYAKVVEQGRSVQGFAQGLQRAGYATDPAYADKLSRVINTALSVQRTIS